MPIYKYNCENEHVFDVMQKLFDDPLASCIECSAPVRKVMQPVNISFKGLGFYSTDYRGGTKSETTTTTKNGESGDKGTEKKSTSSEKVSGNV
jgi:putative FmdB family regulatory protein